MIYKEFKEADKKVDKIIDSYRNMITINIDRQIDEKINSIDRCRSEQSKIDI